jgi:uncharacterized membrane protein YeaQ/YmgE (transglycosylase-associated protein family)
MIIALVLLVVRWRFGYHVTAKGTSELWEKKDTDPTRPHFIVAFLAYLIGAFGGSKIAVALHLPEPFLVDPQRQFLLMWAVVGAVVSYILIRMAWIYRHRRKLEG